MVHLGALEKRDVAAGHAMTDRFKKERNMIPGPVPVRRGLQAGRNIYPPFFQMADGQLPPAPAEEGEAGKDAQDARDDSAAGEQNRQGQRGVGRLVTAPGSGGDGGQQLRTGGGVRAVTLGSLPDEVLAVVFGFCDARARMMAIPAVSRRWLSVCQHLMRHPAIDLAWAVRGYSNYSYAVT